MSCIPCCGGCLVTFWKEECFFFSCDFWRKQEDCVGCVSCCDSCCSSYEDLFYQAVDYKLQGSYETAMDYFLQIRENNQKSGATKTYAAETNYFLYELTTKVSSNYLKRKKIDVYEDVNYKFATFIALPPYAPKTEIEFLSDCFLAKKNLTSLENLPLNSPVAKEIARVRGLFPKAKERLLEVQKDIKNRYERRKLEREESEKQYREKQKRESEERERLIKEHPEIPFLEKLTKETEELRRQQELTNMMLTIPY